MKPTFVTDGNVEIVYDKKGLVRGYKVGRKGCKNPIFICDFKPEYNTPEVPVKIDEYGNSWFKK